MRTVTFTALQGLYDGAHLPANGDDSHQLQKSLVSSQVFTAQPPR